MCDCHNTKWTEQIIYNQFTNYKYDLQLPMQSVPITAYVVSSNLAQARCTRYNIM
jgi:hypothetical protein